MIIYNTMQQFNKIILATAAHFLRLNSSVSKLVRKDEIAQLYFYHSAPAYRIPTTFVFPYILLIQILRYSVCIMLKIIKRYYHRLIWHSLLVIIQPISSIKQKYLLTMCNNSFHRYFQIDSNNCKPLSLCLQTYY